MTTDAVMSGEGVTDAGAEAVMTGARDVVVSLPARDETDVIENCLAGICTAIHHASSLGLVNRVVVVVAAHRCGDDTAAVAARTLRRLGVTGEVIVDDQSTTVGRVRDLAARRGLSLLGGHGVDTNTWFLSTDADTVVGKAWIARILDIADRRSATCVVGVAELDAWRGSLQGLMAYDEVVRSKLRHGALGDEHEHVYGANLAIRADAYLAVGGFSHRGHAEDQQLVDTLATAGFRIARTRSVSVTTSGRTVGRAENGLADLLWRLDHRPRGYDDLEEASARRVHLMAPPSGVAQRTDDPDPADPGPGSPGLEHAATVRR